MATLSKADILGNTTIKKERVNVPEWGGEVWVKELTGKERDHYEGDIFQIKSQGGKTQTTFHRANIRARLLVLAIVDDDSKRLFADHELEELGNLGSSALDKLFTVAQRLSGFTEKDVEELEGN